MPAPPSKLAKSFLWKMRSLEATRQRIELLARRGDITPAHAERVYEGLYVNTQTAFEGFLEDLFVGLLVAGKGLASSRADIVARVEVRSFQVARELVFGPGKPYVDWLPYDHTENRARVFFRGGRPFTELAATHKALLSKSSKIRNAIAHSSDFSLDQFHKKVIGTAIIPHHERRPASYLRGIFRYHPRQTRFEYFAGELMVIANQLAR